MKCGVFFAISLLVGCSIDWKSPHTEQTDAAITGSFDDAGASSHPKSDGSAPAPVDHATPDASTPTSDAGQPDAGESDGESDAGSLPSEFAIAQPGAPCSAHQSETLACDGHASRKSLKCSHGVWEVFATCTEQERCQSHVGPLQGLCASLPAECAGQTPDTQFCAGATRRTCDVDLLSFTDLGCQANTHCEPSAPSACTCDGGYEDDGAGGCRFANDCANNPCVNGTCIDGSASWSCSCASGWTGTQCELSVDDCVENPCHHGGTCIDGLNTYTCKCTSAYTGPNCDTETNPNDCPATACAHGVCVDLDNDYRCNCLPGYHSSGHGCVKDPIGCLSTIDQRSLHPNLPVCP
jgi:hypothetical protein